MRIFNIDLEKDILIIGEIGINHEGNLKDAKNMIKLAAKSGLNAVKFQLYNLKKYEAKDNIFRYSRLNDFNLRDKDYVCLYKLAKKIGINVLATPVTEDKVKLAASFGEVVKVASGDINFFPTIDEIIKQKKKIILSTGNSTINEIRKTVNYIEKKSKFIFKNLSLLHCVSLYPTSIDDANIRKIIYLKKKFPNLTIGYSNHCSEKEAVLSAVSLGAKIIEIHITNDKKNKEFRDHSLSFDNKNLKDLVNSIKLTHRAIQNYRINPCKKQTKIKKFMRKGIVASRNIKMGEKFTKKNLHYARPAIYYQYKDLKKLLGQNAKKNFKSGSSII